MQFNVPWIPPKGRYSLGYFDATIVEELGEPLLTELKNCTKVFLVYSSLKYRGIDQKTIYESTYCYRRFGGKLLMWGGYPWWNECT